MPPSPGRIHSLPVKVLYSIDTSPQSYLAIPNDRQEVYVHPNTLAYSHDQSHGPLGSCCLKAVAKGICFASPECIPNQTTLDFSLYNLDPSLRANVASRAFPTSSNDEQSSWTGRGFLSWLLAEPGQGITLIRGRLTREYEFSSAAFADGGGLEGLMAAAVRREDTDGKGWGLEVCVSLKEVNPEGKSEFSGRREFEEMLARGRGLASTVPSPRRIVPDTRTAVRINGSSSSFPSQVHAGPSNLHPTTAIRAPTPQHFAHPSSTASHRSSLPSPNPPSSTPMASSTSYPKIPSRPPSADQRSTLVPVPSSTSAALRPSTPPPPPQRKSPPPSTPSRATLHALLRSDGKMSPGLAQTLANNPMLLRLLKAVPPSAGPLSSLSETKASPAPDTPTPSTSTTVKLRTEGCDNCGTLESDLWRTKTSKDGTKKKVCNECGIYFNKHKRMRPDDLWAGATRTHKTPKLESELPHLGVRSSPRLHRSTSDHDESPRKRQRSGKMPHPSPRMATRASVKTESGRPKGKALDFSEGMFSPTSTFGTSPANGAGIGALGNGNRGGGEVGLVDIESLLAQFANDQPRFNLDALFANVGDGSGPGGQEMKSLLSAFEGVTDEGASGSAVQNKEGTA